MGKHSKTIVPMPNLPLKVKTIIPVQELIQVEDWWNKLSSDNQKELSTLYEQEDIPQNQTIAIQLCGDFVEQDTSHLSIQKFWLNHFYEYLVNHEIVYTKGFHVGGVCSRHPKAENCVKEGFIPKNFECPYGSKKCLMTHLLQFKPNHSLYLFVKFSLN